MDSDDFVFEQHTYDYEEEYLPPVPWWNLRARWGFLSGAHRTNVVLYALSAVSLALLMLELTSGENNPDLETAGSVISAASTTSTSRPVATSTTRPSSTTTSRPPSSTTIVAGTAGTTPRPVITSRPTLPAAADEDPVVVDPDPEPTAPPQQTTAASAPTTSPTTQPPVTQPPVTQPPVTEPDRTPITLSPRACELLAQHGQTHPSCP